jgi:aryl-alcohol dehydrogenase-like predicted oxidoreductase
VTHLRQLMLDELQDLWRVRNRLRALGANGAGYLTVKIDAQSKFDPKMDVRSEFPRFSSENIAANMPIVDFLRQFSGKKNATPAQISLAW